MEDYHCEIPNGEQIAAEQAAEAEGTVSFRTVAKLSFRTAEIKGAQLISQNNCLIKLTNLDFCRFFL